MNGREKREQLKEEYKTHYRKMRTARERLKQSRKKQNIVEALKKMDSSELLESFDSFLFDVQSKVAGAEARLDVALENMNSSEEPPLQQTKNEEALNRTKAKETVQRVKDEMGLLYSELERRAEAINVDKTVGKSSEDSS